jgi:tetratricopeptide (TPR) repeat protein
MLVRCSWARRLNGLDIAALLIAFGLAAVPAQAGVTAGTPQCCSGIVNDLPPATNYGATMIRVDDPRGAWRPYSPTPLDPPSPRGTLVARIDERERSGGPMASGLAKPVAWLGASHLEARDYRGAIDHFRRAIHLARVNEGLYTPKQIPYVEQLIVAHLARGEIGAADEQQRYLYRVQRHNTTAADPQGLEATLRYADWVRASYLGDLHQHRYAMLVELNDLYDDAIEEVEETEGPDSRELLPYLEGKAMLGYLISVYTGERESGVRVEARNTADVDQPTLQQIRFIRLRDYHFRYGLQALERQVEILEKSGDATPEELADARLAVADWYQWHSRYAEAIRLYEEVWASMDAIPEWRQQVFEEPLELPAGTVFNPGDGALQLLNAAEVRLQFSVNRHGEAKDVEIISPDKSASDAANVAVTRGYHYLRQMRFRPRLEDGVVVAAEQIDRTYRIRF